MIDDVYNSKLLQLAGNITRLGLLVDAQATAKAHSKLCGSTITVSLNVEDGVISDYGQDVKACALGQSSASVVGSHIVGQTPATMRALRKTMMAMLKENGPAPEGDFADLKFLEPVREYKARHGSTLLVFDAVVAALDQIEGRGSAAA